MTPTFVKTCTWSGPKGGGAQFVTLNLQTAAFFDGSKRTAAMMSAAGGQMKPGGVGDESYFLIEGTQVMLWVKKGDSAFKLAVYKQIAPGQKESIESPWPRKWCRGSDTPSVPLPSHGHYLFVGAFSRSLSLCCQSRQSRFTLS